MKTITSSLHTSGPEPSSIPLGPRNSPSQSWGVLCAHGTTKYKDSALEEEAGSCAGLLLFGQAFSGPEADFVNVVLVWRGIEDEI